MACFVHDVEKSVYALYGEDGVRVGWSDKAGSTVIAVLHAIRSSNSKLIDIFG